MASRPVELQPNMKSQVYWSGRGDREGWYPVTTKRFVDGFWIIEYDGGQTEKVKFDPVCWKPMESNIQ